MLPFGSWPGFLAWYISSPMILSLSVFPVSLYVPQPLLSRCQPHCSVLSQLQILPCVVLSTWNTFIISLDLMNSYSSFKCQYPLAASGRPSLMLRCCTVPQPSYFPFHDSCVSPLPDCKLCEGGDYLCLVQCSQS